MAKRTIKRAVRSKSVARRVRVMKDAEIESVDKKDNIDEPLDSSIVAPSEGEPKKLYHVEIYLNDEKFIADTDDLVDAFLSLKPAVIKGKTIIMVDNGTKKIERPVYVGEAKRVFRNKLSAEFFVKNLVLALK